MPRCHVLWLLRTERVDDFVVIGKTPGGVFRKDDLAVDGDIENATVAARQFRIDPGLSLDRGCQTGSLGEIVSTSAICNRQPHLCPHRSRVGTALGSTRETEIDRRTGERLISSFLRSPVEFSCQSAAFSELAASRRYRRRGWPVCRHRTCGSGCRSRTRARKIVLSPPPTGARRCSS